MSVNLVKNLSQLSKSDVRIAGGKGAALGELIRAGLPVPPGFVVTTDAFDRFAETNGLNVEINSILDNIDPKEMHTIEGASENIMAMILSRETPKDLGAEITLAYAGLGAEFVAVRSSATSEDSTAAAWAGQLDSYLNITKETFLENIRRCWASLFTPRAIFYLLERGLGQDKISVAVVVQKMVDSEKSGVAFSVHPVTQDENQLIIEAGFGLGEAIVSGMVTPDSYVVDKRGLRILDVSVNEQTKALYRSTGGGNEWLELGEKGKTQVLSEEEIVVLSELTVRIEDHFGFPCDIEWAKDSESFYIVQSRPITTLDKKIDQFELSDLKDLEYWAEEYKLPLFLFSNSQGTFEDDLLCVYQDNTIRLFALGGRTKSDRESGHERFVSQQDLDEFAQEVKLTIDEMDGFVSRTVGEELSKLSDEQLFVQFDDCLNVLNRFGQVYEKTEPVYFVGIEVKRSDSFLKSIAEYRFSLKDKSRALFRLLLDVILKEMAKRFDLSVDDLYFYTMNELMSLIDTGQKIEVQDRKAGYVLWKSHGEKKVFYGERFKEINDYVDKRMRSGQEDGILTGSVAFGGKVRGRVRILRHNKEDVSKEVEKFAEGDILVTEMTRPDTVMACGKAAAIVTDEGGVVCHAAIIARELKKPCIVGTKIATRILRDGMMVEVDADRGIVKVIEQ